MQDFLEVTIAGVLDFQFVAPGLKITPGLIFEPSIRIVRLRVTKTTFRVSGNIFNAISSVPPMSRFCGRCKIRRPVFLVFDQLRPCSQIGEDGHIGEESLAFFQEKFKRPRVDGDNQPDLALGIFIAEQIGQSLAIFATIIALQVQVFKKNIVGVYAATLS